MITFKQYLAESEQLLGSEDEIIAKIKELCGPFIAQSHGLPLYRGAKESGGVVIVDVRKDRKPRDTNQNAHEWVDRWMKDKTGIAGRSQTLFCTGRRSIANGYAGRGGDLYVVFPVGTFKCLWATKIGGAPMRDLMSFVDQVGSLDPDLSWAELSKEIDRVAEERDLELHTDQLAKAIELHAELMIECDRAILVPNAWITYVGGYDKFFERLK